MSDETQQLGRSLADITVAKIRDALQQSDTACVTQVLEVIQEMSNKAEHLSVQDLAEIVGRDLTTVAKIMKAANCLGYNPGGTEVTTLPQAIGVIGFETIRNLVVSLMLMESAEKRFGHEKSHDVAAVALSTAMTAQAVAQRTPGMNAEQAFVCGALRHYGKLLLSTFMPDEYLDVQEAARETTFDLESTRYFGLTPLDLGQRVLAESNLPKLIQNTLEPARHDLIRSEKLSDLEKLVVVTDFSARLCELIDEPGLTTQSYKTRIKQMLHNYSPSLGLDEEDLEEVIASVSHAMNAVGQAQGFSSFASVVVNRIGRLADGRTLEGSSRGANRDSGQAAAQDFLALGLAEIERLVTATPIDTSKVLIVAARAIRAGLHCRSCLMFLRDAGSPIFSAGIGVGPLYHEVRNQPLIDPAHKDVFSVCIARGEDVMIQNPDEPSIAPFVPSWFRGSLTKGPLLLLPVQDREGTFAVICAVAGSSGRIELSTPRLQHLKKLRSCLSLLRDAGFEQRSAA